MDKNTVGGVYRITNTKTGKIYVGGSVNIPGRWRVHKSELRRGTHRTAPLQNSWNKHGEACFEFEIIEECAKGSVLEREQFYLDTLKPYQREVGYNIGSKAHQIRLGIKHTPESRLKMSLSRKGKKRGTYGHMSEATKEKLRAIMTNRPMPWMTDEFKARIGAAHRGKKRSAVTRNKMRESQRGHVVSAEQRENIRKKLIGSKMTQESSDKKRASMLRYWSTANTSSHREAIATTLKQRHQCTDKTAKTTS